MRLIFYLLGIEIFLIGQILPTIPNNIFRISASSTISNMNWELKSNSFSLHGIGSQYFDYYTYNDSIRFASNYDLYHNGTTYIDSFNTIESWLNNFNSNYGFELPIFGPQDIDTSVIMAPFGTFSEYRNKEITGKIICIEYGLSNDVTLVASIPIIDSYKVRQEFSDYLINPINDAQHLVDYHRDAKERLYTFMASNNYSSLDKGLRDTLELIYNMFYTENGQYSVQWAFHSEDDPINNLLVDNQFLPSDLDKDSVSIDDLVSYYYPTTKEASGLDDMKVGATFLIDGVPPWASDSASGALYGQIFLTIPYGKTLSQFLEKGAKQFKEAKIGSGVSRWSIGLYGEKNINTQYIKRIFFQSQLHFSTTTTLNTPVALFSGGHSNPDSILSLVGNTYKYDMGTGFMINVGFETKRFQNRLFFRSEIFANYKSQDNYISKNNDWNLWMENYSGNFPFYNKVNLKLEVLLSNSLSKYRFGPIPFDLYAGINSTLSANNDYLGWHAYIGITTYYQGW